MFSVLHTQPFETFLVHDGEETGKIKLVFSWSFKFKISMSSVIDEIKLILWLVNFVNLQKILKLPILTIMHEMV